MGKLSDILREQGKLDDIESAWESTDAAGDYRRVAEGRIRRRHRERGRDRIAIQGDAGLSADV